MRTFSSAILSVLFLIISSASFAQTKSDNIKVAGNCGMCKSKIEKSAKAAGATYALWDADKQLLTVKYDAQSASTAAIEKAVAGAGYDTQNVRASNEAYDKLHSCCKYERKAPDNGVKDCKANCCKEAAGAKEHNCEGMNCCKEAGASKQACCKKA
jgi:hypothetical protein